ncbi:DUF4395 domain-containing protein [bacterium endosymbiont of Bathymodiolus sp. 5 South]|jgi:hypothetical protein|uniref:DUF4395 domain-containing protein n=1 Tax=bacterium endosymbiont of Bathymodiolus sp. 5 South TaxID=1181670 RepID=UPI0010B7B177|nr:DUF4395 domain-containing protein [bacterium endosymbiont of Bathymodiolus sp. 5 South]CAC9653099.1 hypothetical protein [uncultured Gammaproteobacteria bacterium]SHN90655.1 hypothetical protein BCLUESOX_793 [bacterium endosymbiont of Bathymodiolus sp. 5 South]SSC07841.1 hypothetical protein BTURTLESOX_1248 [bacterium endosymbiont of Bathymodiolus sp. 5 South]VVH57280.1 hypothetical protein BSPCLSOX_1256 [uncultured Gammaproteobacteria bacterium]VVH57289.1 hypothetical protein BSPCLSOX_1263
MVVLIKNTFKNLWFRDLQEEAIHINDAAVRVRAGILLIIPIYMVFTLISVVYGPHWVVAENTIAMDTFETNWEDQIVYQVEATRRVYDYSFQTKLLIYALFEMLLSLSIIGSRFSPTILLSSFLTLGKDPVWKPLGPKRCAWLMGASFISVCIVFFNPDAVASWVNSLLGTSIPVDENYVPSWLALNLVWICLLFMWLEAIIGYCAGCKLYAILAHAGLVNRHCEACDNIDWDEIKRKKQTKLDKKNKT